VSGAWRRCGRGRADMGGARGAKRGGGQNVSGAWRRCGRDLEDVGGARGREAGGDRGRGRGEV
jgi:hypothetical protein